MHERYEYENILAQIQESVFNRLLTTLSDCSIPTINYVRKCINDTYAGSDMQFSYS